MGIHTFFKSLVKLERLHRSPGEFIFETHSVASHSFKVAQYAQFLGEVEQRHGASIDWKLLYEKALNHDYEEVFIGDIKTPVKYASLELREQLQQVAEGMVDNFINTEIPEEFQELYHEKLKEGKDASIEGQILAVADKIDLLYEAFTEIQKGNTEKAFVDMYQDALVVIKSIDLQCVGYFLSEILPDIVSEEMVSTVDIAKITQDAFSM